jgi:hypothetical protein
VRLPSHACGARGAPKFELSMGLKSNAVIDQAEAEISTPFPDKSRINDAVQARAAFWDEIPSASLKAATARHLLQEPSCVVWVRDRTPSCWGLTVALGLGRDLGLAIPAADKAVDTGSLEPLLGLLTAVVQEHARDRFAAVMATKGFNADDLAAGRAHVRAYVEFVHFVERLYEAASTVPDGHFEERDTRGIEH